MHTCIHPFIHASIHPSIHEHMHPRIHSSSQSSIHSSTHSFLIHPCIHTYIHPCIRPMPTSIHACTCIYIHTNRQIHVDDAGGASRYMHCTLIIVGVYRTYLDACHICMDGWMDGKLSSACTNTKSSALTVWLENLPQNTCSNAKRLIPQILHRESYASLQ
jgi:hypothetical protein